MRKSFSKFSLLLLLLLLLSLFGASVPAALAGDNNIHWDDLGHNSRDPLFRYPQGAVPTGTAVTLRLRALDGDLTSAQVRVWNDRVNVSTNYEMSRVAGNVTTTGNPTAYEYWEVTLPASAVSTVYWYRFIVNDGSSTAYYEDDAGRTSGWGQTFASSPDYSYQLTHYDPAFETPDWIKDAVVYQIFVDRFRDGNPVNNETAGSFFYGNNDSVVRSNGTDWNTRICDPRSAAGSTSTCAGIYSQNFYGGDLQGVIDELDYLQDLGVTAIYLNPIFESPSNHKYDTTDFMQIDDNFGDLALFQQLSTEAGARGIHLILDGVFNHTSSDSIYFDRYGRYSESGACESTSSPYIDWYPFKPYVGTGTPPCSENRDYNYWFGIFDSLPVLDHDDPGVRDYFLTDGVNSVAPYWMQWADGWRLDVAPEIDHGTINDPTDDYMETLRTAIHAVNPDAYIVGEEWGNATSWTIDNQWDATMNYQYSSAYLSFFRGEDFVDNDHNSGSSAGILAPLTPYSFNERILNWQERYAPEAYQAMMNLLGSHDTSRALFMLDENVSGNSTALYNNPNYDWSDAITRLKAVVIAQMTMPGAPTIYYGDEVGTVNPPAWDGSQWQDDPYNRVPYPWLDETGTPYYTHMQTEAAQSDIYDHYAALTEARHAHASLRTGELIPLLADDTNGIYAYLRLMADDSDAAVVILNNSGTTRDVTLNLSGHTPANLGWTELLTSATYTSNSSAEITVSSVPGIGGAVLFPNTSFAGQRPAAVTDLSGIPGANQVTLDWSDVPGTAVYGVYRSRLSHGGWEWIANAEDSDYQDAALTNSIKYWYMVVPVTESVLEADDSNEVGVIPQIDLTSGAWYNLQWPHTINHVLSATTPTENIYAQLWIGGVTDVGSPNPAPGIMAQVGYGPAADAPSLSSWTWFDMAPNPGYNFAAENNDEFVGTMLPTQAGTFNYTTRWSSDGGNTWYYTDKSGPPYDPNDAGVLTVTESEDAIAPDAPTNLEVTGTTSVSVSLTWDAHPDTDGDLFGFNIYRAEVVGGTPGASSKIGSVNNAAATSYVDNTVTGGITYEYVITAVDTSLNESEVSNAVQATAEMRTVTVTLRVTVPSGTPGTVTVAGNFGEGYPEWNPGAMTLTQVGANVWEREFTILDGTQLEYKYARGSWETVEKEANGNTEIGNRMATVDYGISGDQLIENTVANWRDPFVIASNAGAVAPNSTFTVTWNQSMNSGSVTDPAGFVVNGPSGAVSGTLAYDDGTRTVTFTPSAPLTTGGYTATISGRQDAGGDVQQVTAVLVYGIAAYDLSTNSWYNLQYPPTITATQGEVTPNIYGQIWISGVTDASSSPVANLKAQVGYGPAADAPSLGSWTWFDMMPNSSYDFSQNNDEYVGTMTPTQTGTFNYTTRWSADGGATWYYTDKNAPPYDSADAGVMTVSGTGPLMVDVTFDVTVPEGTPGTVYLAGGFGLAGYAEWNPGGMAMTEISTNHWQLTLDLPDGYTTEYKFARGSWETVEKQADGNAEAANHALAVAYGVSGEQTFTNTVANWRDPYVIASVPADGAVLLSDGMVNVQWNQSMNAGSVTNGAGFVVTGPSGVISGSLAYDDTMHLVTFTPAAALTSGSYTVAISGRQDAGGDSQQVAFSSTFSVEVESDGTPAVPVAIAPSGTFTAQPTEFSWNESVGAAWYYLWIGNTNGSHVLDQWYEAATVCSAGVCTVTPPITIGGGQYVWFLQAKNDIGSSAWSGATSFTIAVQPGLVTPIAPIGSITSGTPEFKWTEVSDSTWYYLWISGPEGYVLDQWYNYSSICSSGMCAVTPGLNLTPGAYRWWLQAWSPTGGHGNWTSEVNFSVNAPLPSPTQIAPIGTQVGLPVTYSWSKVSGATWYYLWVSDARGPKMISQMYASSSVCNETTCSVSPSLFYTNGITYRWWIAAGSEALGYGPWSAEARFDYHSSGGSGGEADVDLPEWTEPPSIGIDPVIIPAPVEPLPPEAGLPPEGSSEGG